MGLRMKNFNNFGVHRKIHHSGGGFTKNRKTDIEDGI